MAKRQEWPLKGLRIDLKDGYYWLVAKRSTRPFIAKFKSDPHLAGGGSWRLDYGTADIYASHVYEEHHLLGPVEMIIYERE